jgi:hypothetical protein
MRQEMLPQSGSEPLTSSLGATPHPGMLPVHARLVIVIAKGHLLAFYSISNKGQAKPAPPSKADLIPGQMTGSFMHSQRPRSRQAAETATSAVRY